MGFTCSELQGNFEALTMEVGLDFSSEELKAEQLAYARSNMAQGDKRTRRAVP